MSINIKIKTPLVYIETEITSDNSLGHDATIQREAAVEQAVKLHLAVSQNQENHYHWISPNAGLPELLPNKNYSENVLAICDGELRVMCLCYNTDPEEEGFFWADCDGKIDGEAYFDDQEWLPDFWCHLPNIIQTT